VIKWLDKFEFEEVIVINKALLYIHGKNGNVEEMEYYKSFFSDYDIYGLDYKGVKPWEVKEEILTEYEKLSNDYDYISIIANSIGAYFAMNALSEKKLERAFFISPIVDMEKLINEMMLWDNVTEQELQNKKEMETSFGEILSWEYLCYVRKHPIIWNVETDILYAGNDNLTSHETISKFAKETNSSLEVMKNGEHWFHTNEQLEFLNNWLISVI